MNIVARQSFKGTVVSYIGAFIGFLTTFFVLTKFLTPEEIGLTRILLEAGMLLSSLGMLGLTASIFRFFPYFKELPTSDNPKPEHHGFFYYLMKIGIWGAILVCLLYVLLHKPLAIFFGRNSTLFVDYYYSVIPLTVFLIFWLIFELYAVQMMRIAVPKFIREIVLRLMLVSVYIAYALGWVSLRMMIVLLIGVYGLCTLLAFLYLRRIAYTGLKHDNSFVSKVLKKEFFHYTLLYVLAALGGTMASRMDLFMVSSLDSGGLSSAGIFSIAFFIVAVVDIPSRSIMAMSTPQLAQAMKDQDMGLVNKLFQRVSFFQLLVGGVIFLLIWFNIDNVFSILPNGNIYKAGAGVVFYLGIAKLVEITFNFTHPIVSCSKFYHWNLYYTAMVLAVSIVLNIWFIPRWGIVGAAQATLITVFAGYGIQQLLIYWFMRIHPFSGMLFRLIPLFAIMIAVDYILPTMHNHWIDLLVRCAVEMLVVLIVLYSLKMVPEFFSMLTQLRDKVRNSAD